MTIAWPEADRIERERMERPRMYCPVCARAVPHSPGAGVIELSRRLARHLSESHDFYFLAQLRIALGASPAETDEDPFHPTGDAW